MGMDSKSAAASLAKQRWDKLTDPKDRAAATAAAREAKLKKSKQSLPTRDDLRSHTNTTEDL